MPVPASQLRRLRDYGGCFILSVHCKGCHHEHLIAAEAFAKRFGWDARVPPLLERLRCSRCRARDPEVWVLGIPR